MLYKVKSYELVPGSNDLSLLDGSYILSATQGCGESLLLHVMEPPDGTVMMIPGIFLVQVGDEPFYAPEGHKGLRFISSVRFNESYLTPAGTAATIMLVYHVFEVLF